MGFLFQKNFKVEHSYDTEPDEDPHMADVVKDLKEWRIHHEMSVTFQLHNLQNSQQHSSIHSKKDGLFFYLFILHH